MSIYHTQKAFLLCGRPPPKTHAWSIGGKFFNVLGTIAMPCITFRSHTIVRARGRYTIFVRKFPGCFILIIFQVEVCQCTGMVSQEFDDIKITDHCCHVTGCANVMISRVHIATTIIEKSAYCLQLMILSRNV